jgi:murein L,D-transpeptidase YcbB/YkuD
LQAEEGHTVVVPVVPAPTATGAGDALPPLPAARTPPPAEGVDVSSPELQSSGEAGAEVQIVEEPPPPPPHPVVGAIRTQLADPARHKGAAAADIAALEEFYGERLEPPLWISEAGFSERAKSAIREIQDAVSWGLDPHAFSLPSADDVPASVEAQAADEIKLDLAILKYARYARGGRLTPSRVNPLFDQKPPLRKPETVLAEISVADAPDAYLRDLHPKHKQFEQLRQALLRTKDNPYEPVNEQDTQRLIINMERWRWMPPELGSFHVWNNVPEFMTRVSKDGNVIYVEKVIVGQLKYATPFFSAKMSSVVFHPEWVVPETILREDLQPSLQQPSGPFGSNTAVLQQHQLRVAYKGQPIDPNTVDWPNVNIRQYTFIQSPGPHNVLGKFKFNFPNRHAVYMHDTPQRELFAEPVRTLSHGCIRVNQPEQFAALLLAEDKGWSPEQVYSMLDRGNNTVKLHRTIPVHLTYFTAVADDYGSVGTYTDIYGLDGPMARALFGNSAASFPPAPPPPAAATPQRQQPARRSGDPFAALISGLFGN